MATFLQISILYLLLISLCRGQSASRPKALLLPIRKDASTLQYLTRFGLGTPLVPRQFVVDLGGENLWMACESGYKSSTYKPGRCGSASCSLAKTNGCFDCVNRKPGPGCTNNTCSLIPENPLTKRAGLTEEMAIDTISLQSTDGSRSGPRITIPNFIFSCATDSLLLGLARWTKGMIGLGRKLITLPFQLSSSFGETFLRRKFALCLPSTSNSTGVLLFGDSPYNFFASYNQSKLIDITERFHYTKLFINPVSSAAVYIHGEPSAEYFVAVKAITIDNKPVTLNTTLLSINDKGIGGCKISTVDPYTVLHSSIYKALATAFAAELKALNVAKVAPVGKFKDCFSTKILGFSPLGWGVPDIEFVFEGADAVWEVVGANSMVQINRDVVCLGFVDGGSRVRTSIVIGAHQMEDNLLQFDLSASRLGFSSSLFFAATQCDNFKI